MLHANTDRQDLKFTLEQQGDLFVIQVTDGRNRQIGRCKAYLTDAQFGDTTVKAMAIGAVGTEPEYRRGGVARECFRLLDAVMAETGVLVSYLHPFSFSYYRAMGYERVSDHRVLEFPITGLDFLPRCPDLIRHRSVDDIRELVAAYHRFCQGRNILFRRDGAGITTEPRSIASYMYGHPYEYDFKNYQYFLSRDAQGCPDGYVMLRKDMQLRDHYLFGTLHVEELCFASPQTLRKLLGFLRMYEGEVDTVVIHNSGMAPEVERMLRHYKYTNIRVAPDLSARIHDVGKLLAAVTYPREKGAFTVRVTDCSKSPFSRENTEGVWHVAYENGKGTVTRLEACAPWDLSAPMPAFTQLLHGFESYGAQTARYTEGVELKGDCPDFFRAFPNRPCGLFELF